MVKILFTLFIPACLGIVVTDPPLETDYKYSYDVVDPSTGDTKSQLEVRQGDIVRGFYTVLGPDGTKRTVEYTADTKHGFKATLKEEPLEDISRPPFPEKNSIRKPTEKPIYHYIEPRKKQPYAGKHQGFVYFTPASSVKPKKTIFHNGKLFLPAYEHL